MSQKAIGPDFQYELVAAGVSGLPFTWDSEGNIAFGATLTTEQISAIEAVYAAHNPAAIPLVQQAAMQLASGIQIVSTSTPTLDGTFACDSLSQADIVAIETSLNAGKGFPGGATTFNYPDVSGVMHAFSESNFTDFA
ncbi:hypothetical protein GCM10027093_11200 [Paraburkholderia jirisanensis]